MWEMDGGEQSSCNLKFNHKYIVSHSKSHSKITFKSRLYVQYVNVLIVSNAKKWPCALSVH